MRLAILSILVLINFAAKINASQSPEEIEMMDLSTSRKLDSIYNHRQLTYHEKMQHIANLSNDNTIDAENSGIISERFVQEAKNKSTSSLTINRPIHTISHGLWSIPFLTHLDLSNCKLEQLPLRSDVASQSSLKVLVLNNNLLSSLPRSLAFMPKLEFLSLENNKFEAVPEVLLYLKHIQYISMGGNSLASKKHRAVSYNFIDKASLNSPLGFFEVSSTQRAPAKVVDEKGVIRTNPLDKSPIGFLRNGPSWEDNFSLDPVREALQKKYNVRLGNMEKVFARTANDYTVSQPVKRFHAESIQQKWENQQTIENRYYQYPSDRFLAIPHEVWEKIFAAFSKEDLVSFANSSFSGYLTVHSYLKYIQTTCKQGRKVPFAQEKLLKFANEFVVPLDTYKEIIGLSWTSRKGSRG